MSTLNGIRSNSLVLFLGARARLAALGHRGGLAGVVEHDAVVLAVGSTTDGCITVGLIIDPGLANLVIGADLHPKRDVLGSGEWVLQAIGEQPGTSTSVKSLQ